MKRTLTLMLALIMICMSALTGCNKGGKDINETKKPTDNDDEVPKNSDYEIKWISTNDLPELKEDYDDSSYLVHVKTNNDNLSHLLINAPNNSLIHEKVSVCNGADCCSENGLVLLNVVPAMLTKTAFEEMIAPLQEAYEDYDPTTASYEQKIMRAHYLKLKYCYILKDPRDTDAPEVYIEATLKQYPITKYTPIYLIDGFISQKDLNEICFIFSLYSIYDESDCKEDIDELYSIAKSANVDNAELNLPERTDLFKSIEFGQSVREIQMICPYDYVNVEKIVIPSSVTYINQTAFGGLEKLTVIEYKGTMEEWAKIKTGSDSFASEGFTVYKDVTVKCVDGDVLIASAIEEK